MAITCRGCRREFETRGGLTTHKRACTAKLTEATATSLAKRRRDHEAQQIAKVRRQEEVEAASRARDEIRDNEACDLGDADNLVISLFCILVVQLSDRFIRFRDLRHPLCFARQGYQTVADIYQRDFVMISLRHLLLCLHQLSMMCRLQ